MTDPLPQTEGDALPIFFWGANVSAAEGISTALGAPWRNRRSAAVATWEHGCRGRRFRWTWAAADRSTWLDAYAQTLRASEGVILGFDPTLETWEELHRRAFLVRHASPAGNRPAPTVAVLLDLLNTSADPDETEVRLREVLYQAGLPGDDLPLATVTAREALLPATEHLSEDLAEGIPPRSNEDPRPLRMALTRVSVLSSGATCLHGPVLQGTLVPQALDLVGEGVCPVKLRQVLGGFPVVAPREAAVRLKGLPTRAVEGRVLAAAGTLGAWFRVRCAVTWLDPAAEHRGGGTACLPAGNQRVVVTEEGAEVGSSVLTFPTSQPLEVGQRFLLFCSGPGAAEVVALVRWAPRTELYWGYDL
ncbi:MAG: hypothetical protein HY909_07905 [Deltaproteobacteria bacterium]|nr:hypothetical protein [Deltaproteobacteria bacterium]